MSQGVMIPMCHHASPHAACHNCIGSQSTAQAGTLWDHSCARPYSCMHSRGGLTPPSLHRPTGTYGAAILRSEGYRALSIPLPRHVQQDQALCACETCAAVEGCCWRCMPNALSRSSSPPVVARASVPCKTCCTLICLSDGVAGYPHTLPSDATKQPCTTPVGGCACHVLLCLADGTQLPIPGAMR